MAYATVEDVEVRFGRALTGAEREQAAAWISDVEVEIRERIPNLDDLIAAGRPSAGTVLRVVAAVVIRKLQNPEGLRQRTVSIDDYSRTDTVDTQNSDGWLGLTDREWNLLLPGASGDAFSIRPFYAPGYYRTVPEEW